MIELNEAQLTQLYEEWSALGEKRAEERIIKLLETTQLDCPCNCGDLLDAEPFIALIKGEQK